MGMAVPGTGLGGANPLLEKLMGRAEESAKYAATQEGEFKASQEREAAARTAQQAALAPKREALKTELGNVPPEPQPVPVPQAPPGIQIDAKEMSETISLVTALAAIGGALTRQPLTAALNSFSAGVHGFVQGKQQVFDDNLKTFNANLKKAHDENDAVWKKYKAAQEKHGTDIAGLQAELQLIAAETQNPIDMELAKRGDLVSLMKMHESTNNNFNKVLEHAAQMQQRADIAAQASADRRAIATQASLDRQAARLAKNAGDGGVAGASPGGVSQKYTADPEYKKQVDFWAKQIAMGGALPARFAQSVGKQFASDVNLAAPSFGTAEDLTANRVTMRKTMAEAQKLGTQSASVSIANKELERFIPLAEAAIDKVPRTGFKPINKLIQLGEAQWSPEQKELAVANRAIINAYSQLIQRGAPTVHSLTEAKELLETADSPGVYKAALQQLVREGKAAEEGLVDAHEGLLKNVKRMGSRMGEGKGDGAKSFASEAEAAAAGLTPGTKITIGGVPGTWH